MRALRFGKPKNPGFGISREFYLSVLSSRATRPTMLEIVNPNGDGGAVEGLGAPLAEGADKDSLNRPLERGTYAVATKDRTTVLRMVVLSKEEAGFTPEPLLQSPLASTLEQEILDRLRTTWTLVQLSFESHDPRVYPALDFVMAIAQRIGLLSEGVVADPIAQRYALPQSLFQPMRLSPEVDARELIGIQFRAEPHALRAVTAGLRKFGLPELEVAELRRGSEEDAARFLIAAAQAILVSGPMRPGAKLGAAEIAFTVHEAPASPGSYARYELRPPVRHTADEAIAAWVEETA